MYPFLLPDIFGYNLPMYDIMIMVGIFAMLIYVTRRFEMKDGLTRKQTNKLILLIVFSLLAALVSSYIVDGFFHFIGDYQELRAEGYTFIEIVQNSFGSITFIGGLVGGVVTFILLFKYKYKEENKDLKKTMNTLITGVVLAHAFGRIGCFFAGCCYGIPTDSFLGVHFPYGHSLGEYVYPTQLFESAFLFLLFIGLNTIKKFRGIELEVYMMAYGTFRFLNEFIRGDDRGSIFGFITTEYNSYPSPSQYLSLLLIAGGVYLYLKQKKQKKLEAGE